MAEEILTVPLAETHTVTAPPKYGPADHEKASNLKVVRLLGLGEGFHGKTGTFEFAGGFVRSIDIDAETIWHSLFGDLDRKEFWRLVRHVETRTRCDDGTVVIQDGPMWFWTRRTTPRGRELESNLFDVPEEGYAAGRLTGAKAARDLILFLRKYERARELDPWAMLNNKIKQCLAQAFALESSRHFNEASRGNAAITFCNIVTGYFLCGASHANPAYLDGQVDQEERGVAWELDYEQQNRKEVAERMQVVRAAKAAKRAGNVMSLRKLQSTEGAASNGHTLQ